MAGMSSLALTATFPASWAAQNNQTGGTPVTNNNSPSYTLSLGTAAANNAAGGADELISKVYTIAGSGSTTIDLTALVDVLLTSGVSLARLKYVEFALLSSTATTGAVDTTNGTVASSVTVGNAGTNANLLFLGGTTPTFTLTNGDLLRYGTPGAAGITVDGTHKNVLVTNNAAGSAAVKVTLGGGST